MQISPTLRKLLRTRKSKDIFIFIFFFVFATLLWYGHAMQSVRTTRVPVKIRYIGKNDSIGLSKEGLPTQVMIDVRDAGHRLNMYHQEPLQITLNLGPYIDADTGTIQIPSNDLRASIKAVLQDNSKLIDTDLEEIRCGYYKEHKKTVNLTFDGEIQLADGYQLICSPQLSPKQINIYGKKEVLKSIQSIPTQHMVFTNVIDTLRTHVPIIIPEGVRVEADGEKIEGVDIEVQTEQYAEKRFIVPIETLQVPEGCTMHIFPDKVEVSVRIGMSHYADLKASDIKVYCIYQQESDQAKLAVQLDYSANPHITSAWVYPVEVEYINENGKDSNG